MRIAIDVGGTNTDAVLMDGNQVVAARKSPTTATVSDGIVQAISSVLQQSGVAARHIQCVMIGTTQFANAFVERRHLAKIGIIRLSLPASRGIPPLIDWPDDIRSAVCGHVALIRGGYQYDGRLNSALDEAALIAAIRQIKERGITAIAVSGLFSPVNAAMESRAEEMILKEIPDAKLTLSSRIGRIGLIERENAAIMNASLADLSGKVVSSFLTALDQLGIQAPFFISQNDGTLMQADFVKRYPVLTFASGQTNSMRGAAYLSGLKDALVADIGGTTTDIGMLVNGFPRESAATVDIGGVKTNFRMPDVVALGLGGGSMVSNGKTLQIGPQSVGYRLLEEARIFGGNKLTASDIAVAAGFADFGDSNAVTSLDKALVEQAITQIHTIVADGIDRIKTSADPLPLVLVGGGSLLANRHIVGTSRVIVPDHADVANAIGASIAQVGGEIDRVYSYDDLGREAAIDQATRDAKAAAVKAGAMATTVQLIDVEEVPVAYIPGGSVKLRVKVAGDLDLEGLSGSR